MLRRIAIVALALLAGALPAAAQSAAPPARAAAASSPAEDAVIRAGIALHDAGKYDDAIAKYQEVLKDHPDNMAALFELAYSYNEKKDYARSIEAARRGTQYASELLAMFYDLIGTALDAGGEPAKAIEAYTQGIAVVPDAGMLYHNLAVTYLESLKNTDEARRTLQRGLRVDPLESQMHLLLGQVFKTGNYNAQAFFAYATYLLIEPNGRQSTQAYGNWRAILKGGVDAPIDGVATGTDAAMRGRPGMPARSDEGDFSDIEAQFISSQRAFIADLDAGANEMTALVNQINRVLLFVEGRALGRDRNAFATVMYLPYFRELKQRNYVEPFVYWISQRSPAPGVREWLNANQPRVREFLAWTQNYAWPQP